MGSAGNAEASVAGRRPADEDHPWRKLAGTFRSPAGGPVVSVDDASGCVRPQRVHPALEGSTGLKRPGRNRSRPLGSAASCYQCRQPSPFRADAPACEPVSLSFPGVGYAGLSHDRATASKHDKRKPERGCATLLARPCMSLLHEGAGHAVLDGLDEIVQESAFSGLDHDLDRHAWGR
jgi:hypothetical protein